LMPKRQKQMLRIEDESLVRSVLSSLRKRAREADVEIDARHVKEVVEALRVAGFVIIPRGSLDAITKILSFYDEQETD
jgi:hypothetical protein